MWPYIGKGASGWEELYAINARLVRGWLIQITSILSLGALGFTADWFFGPSEIFGWFFIAFGIVWFIHGVYFLVDTTVKWVFFRCPNCHHHFHDKVGFSMLVGRCANCDIKRWSPLPRASQGS
jgi:hypothetical protein